MVLPLVQILVLSLKTTARPIAAFLKVLLKKNGSGRQAMRWVGCQAHLFEIWISKRSRKKDDLIDHQVEEEVHYKTLSDEEQFQKGVEWFVEVTFLYGVIGLISLAEMIRAIRNSKKAARRLLEIEGDIDKNEENLKRVHKRCDELEEELKNMRSQMSQFKNI